jgi:hypothetical protein
MAGAGVSGGVVVLEAAMIWILAGTVLVLAVIEFEIWRSR